MTKGSCLCGKVRFDFECIIKNIVYCHCSQCRKAQGSAFAANGIVDSDSLKFSSGEDKLTAYESTPGQIKYFCSVFGSPVISRNVAKPDQVRIRLGTIDSGIDEKPEAHIFVSSKAEWDSICDDLPQYDSWEPGR